MRVEKTVAKKDRMQMPRTLLRVSLIFLTVAVMAFGQQRRDSFYVVTHVDVIPDHTKSAEDLLKRYASESRQQPGVIRFEIQQELALPNHFTIVEIWQSRQAFEAHQGGAHSRRFREDLQPLRGAPLDQRPGHLLD